jgi:hypothetical protein
MQRGVLTLLPGILNKGTALLLSYLLESIIMVFSRIHQERVSNCQMFNLSLYIECMQTTFHCVP